MKQLLNKLFGGHSRQAAQAPARPEQKPEPTLAALRQRILDSAADANESAIHARELGQRLGRLGVTPADADPRSVWVHAIRAATDQELARRWLASIDDESELEDIAAGARLADLRLMAARRITDLDRIARLAGLMRDRDRGVFRHCQTVLRHEADKAARRRDIERIRQELARLVATRPIASGQLYELRKCLHDLGDGHDLQACRELLQEAGLLEKQDFLLRKELDGLVREAEALEKALGAALPGSPRFEKLQKSAAELTERRQSLPEWLLQSTPGTSLEASMESIASRLAEAREDIRRANACRQFLIECAGRDITPESMETWRSLPLPVHAGLREALRTEWDALTGDQPTSAATPARPRLPAASVMSATELDAIRSQLDRLQEALDGGETQQALTQARELDNRLAHVQLPRGLARRHRQLNSRLAGLREWARWGSHQARNKLIDEAEDLAMGPHSLAYIEKTVPHLREEWRRLDGLSHASRELWQRFDQALNRAYQPILDQRAQRDAEWEAIGKAKAALLDEGEHWLAGVGENSEPADLQRKARALRQHWQELPATGPQMERQLRVRFQAFMQNLEKRIDPFIQSELDRRNKLLMAATRLIHESNLHEAVNQARQLKRDWREAGNGVQLPRSLNDRQWQRFREAIDSVFARREAERHKVEAQRHEQNATWQTLLDDFESTLDSQPRLGQIEAALAAFQEEWSAAHESSHGGPLGVLEQKADDLVQRARTMMGELQHLRRQRILGLMQRKAHWCEALEQAALAGNPDLDALHERVQSEWRESPVLPSELERKLAERFRKALTVRAEDLESGHRKREELLLELEILLDLPSPPELSQARQRRQLEWLQAGFKPNRDATSALALAGTWHGLAATPNDAHNQRMNRVTETLHAQPAAQAPDPVGLRRA